MKLLDTNAVSALLAGDKALGRVLETDERHALPTIVLGEYRFGLLRARARRALEPLLDELERESVVLNVEADTARVYAQVRERLRRAGKSIPENDVWIAALAVQHGLPVVSRDAHLDWVEGLTRLTW